MFKYRGMWQSLILVGREEGRRGLYAGMGTHVARVVSFDWRITFFFSAAQMPVVAGMLENPAHLYVTDSAAGWAQLFACNGYDVVGSTR